MLSNTWINRPSGLLRMWILQFNNHLSAYIWVGLFAIHDFFLFPHWKLSGSAAYFTVTFNLLFVSLKNSCTSLTTRNKGLFLQLFVQSGINSLCVCIHELQYWHLFMYTVWTAFWNRWSVIIKDKMHFLTVKLCTFNIKNSLLRDNRGESCVCVRVGWFQHRWHQPKA